MIKVNYDEKTGEILGFYPDFISYANIPEPNIEIDAATHQDCINNQGLRRVDLTSLKIIEYVPPEPPKTTEELLSELDAEYQPQFSSLSLAWATANMDGNTELAASIKADKDDLTTEYNTKREEITNGN